MIEKRDILFPFDDYRKIQKEMIEEVAKTIESGKNLVMHAPTGLGKTTVLSPAITYARKNKKKVLFLTPRHSQHRIATDLVRRIKERYDENILLADFLGKKHLCSQVTDTKKTGSSTFYEYCRYLRKNDLCDYYTNLTTRKEEQKQLLKSLEVLNPLDAEDVKKRCTEAGFCPYEISAKLAEKARVIIGDYYHLFSEPIRESLFRRINIELHECIVIVDEAHNLPERTKDLLTATITLPGIERAEAQNQKYNLEIGQELRLIKEALVLASKEIAFAQTEKKVTKASFKIDETIAETLSEASESIFESEERNNLLPLVHFITSWNSQEEDGFLRMVQKEVSRRGTPTIRLSKKCIDPSKAIRPVSEGVHSMIAMSGTLTPVAVYKDLLGIQRSEAIEFANPFPRENELNLIVPRTTTQYQKRSEAMYQAIAIQCTLITDAVPGNLAIYFPSYSLLNEVKSRFETKCKKPVFTETPEMTKEEKTVFLENFKKHKSRGAVLLGASTGSFGEGIDLIGDFLKAVVIVGMPFTKPDLETQETINYLDYRFGNGWDYGYFFPMLTKTLQNAGRCIRSETDKGVIIFLDERYNWPRYKKYFPKTKEFKTTLDPVSEIQRFFKE